jgi:hypothetical protein
MSGKKRQPVFFIEPGAVCGHFDSLVSLSLQEPELFCTEVGVRMPFRYGIATMSRFPHLLLQLRVVMDGRSYRGQTADHLPPKWFTKDPQQAPAEEIEQMLRVIRHAVARAAEIRAQTPFDLWQQLYRIQREWGQREGLPPLLTNFGVALVEKAMLDGFCRGCGCTLSAAIQENRLGIRLGDIHPDLQGSAPPQWLPSAPLRQILVRHTVGLGDPLQENDIAAEVRLADGLPQSLEAAIRAYGLRHFKVKVAGAAQNEFDRLIRLSHLLDEACGDSYAVTLDGNESFVHPEEFHLFVRCLTEEPQLATLRQRLLFIEQPFHRSIALLPEVKRAVEKISATTPIIIDESDAELESLPQALALGYSGTSHKNCKGIFKGIAHTCLLQHHRQEVPGRRFIMSGEDLTNIPPLALQQDLAVQALLGNESVERNGHHYFAGLSHLPRSLQEELLRAHPDLFRQADHTWPALAISGGRLTLESVNHAPFGTPVHVDPSTWRQISSTQ